MKVTQYKDGLLKVHAPLVLPIRNLKFRSIAICRSVDICQPVFQVNSREYGIYVG